MQLQTQLACTHTDSQTKTCANAYEMCQRNSLFGLLKVLAPQTLPSRILLANMSMQPRKMKILHHEDPLTQCEQLGAAQDTPQLTIAKPVNNSKREEGGIP